MAVSEAIIAQAYELYSSGFSLRECSDRFKISHITFYKRFKDKYGIRTKGHGRRVRDQLRGRRPHKSKTRLKISRTYKIKYGRVCQLKKRGHYRHPSGICETAWLKRIVRKNKCCSVLKSKDNLVAHHLNSFSAFPKDRWKEANVVVITSKLHQYFHTKYMKRFSQACTESDWKTFLETTNIGKERKGFLCLV